MRGKKRGGEGREGPGQVSQGPVGSGLWRWEPCERVEAGGTHSGCSPAPSGGLEENSQFVEAETKHRSACLRSGSSEAVSSSRNQGTHT